MSRHIDACMYMYMQDMVVSNYDNPFGTDCNNGPVVSSVRHFDWVAFKAKVTYTFLQKS